MSRLVYGARPAGEEASITPKHAVFDRLHELTPTLSGAERRRIFEALPPWVRQLAWLELEQTVGGVASRPVLTEGADMERTLDDLTVAIGEQRRTVDVAEHILRDLEAERTRLLNAQELAAYEALAAMTPEGPQRSFGRYDVQMRHPDAPPF